MMTAQTLEVMELQFHHESAAARSADADLQPALSYPGVLRLCLREARPVVQLMCLLRFLCGVVLANGVITYRVFVGAAAWAAACLAIYVFNGLTDLTEDRANHSARPIASGALTVVQARTFVAISAILAVLLSSTCEDRLIWVVELQLALGYGYSGRPFRMKRSTVGGPLIGCLGAVFLSVLAGYASVPHARASHTELFVFLCAISLWTGLVGQSKDLPDVEGDTLAGRHTLACLLGEWLTRLTLAAFALVLSGAFLLTTWMFEPALLIPAISMALGALGFTAVLLSPISSGAPGRRRRPYHVYMITQYVMCLQPIIA